MEMSRDSAEREVMMMMVVVVIDVHVTEAVLQE